MPLLLYSLLSAFFWSQLQVHGKREHCCSTETVSSFKPLVGTTSAVLRMFEDSNASSDGGDSSSCDRAWAQCSECSEPICVEDEDPPVDYGSLGAQSGTAAAESSFGRILGRGLGPTPSRIGKTTGVTNKRGGHSRENTMKRLPHF
eukprot:6206440-Pleurochrysis_carterae.AAC.1